MRWVGYRRRQCLTQAGLAKLIRGYWVCPTCGTGCAPYDVQLCLPAGQVSMGVQHGVALLGQALPYGQAADLYEKLLGVRISQKSTEVWTEALGATYAPPVPTRYEPGPSADTLFILADAGLLLTREDGWKERKVFAAWRQVDGDDQPVRYAVGAGSWDDQVPLVADLARREGSRLARKIVCLADGAPAIWKVLTRLWPEAFQLLDWFHLMEHLDKVAIHLSDKSAWRERQQTALLTQGYRPVAQALATLAQTGATQALRAAAKACLRYVWTHRMRMDYPEAQRRGYPIGSGRIESAVKQVLQHRCKQAGMRWKAEHLNKVLAARCAYLNGDWEMVCQQARRAA